MTNHKHADSITIGVTGQSEIELAIDRVLEPRLRSVLLAQATTMQILESIAGAGYICVPRKPSQMMIDAAWADAHEEDARGVWQSIIQAFDQSTRNSFSGNG